MKQVNKYTKTVLLVLIGSVLLYGCKKSVTDPPPATSLNSENVYTNNSTTAAVLTGVYSIIMNGNNLPEGALIDMSFYPGLSADELTLWPGSTNLAYIAFYTNELTNSNGNQTFWEPIYSLLYSCNAAIEGINASPGGLTPQVQQQALGEAYFMRALCYFYLVNLYGDLPLVLTTNYQVNAVLARTPQAAVWQQIISDLKTASPLLSVNYLDATLQNPTSARLRPTKWAACALLARAYLYQSQWQNAINEADTVINNSSLFQLDTLNGVFLANSTEAIWQLQPTAIGWNTPDAQIFIIPSTGLSNNWPVYLSPNLLNSFEPGDQRRLNWVDSVTLNNITYYYPYKYKNNILNAAVTEYEMVLRLGEQYLIRAEAEAQMNDLSDAATDLNAIRNRAGLGDTSVNNTAGMVNAILHERQVELFTEWGHRWLDMKRTNTLNSTMGTPGNAYLVKVPGGAWNSNWQLYPIPLSEVTDDHNLIQNPGYN